VAFSGRDRRKAVDTVLAAWRQLAPRGLGLTLLAGAGIPPELEPQLAELERHGQVRVMPYQPQERLVGLISGATALLYPTREEGFGLPVLEAMAAGVPVITGLAPVTLEVGGDAALKLDPDDPVGSASRHVERLLDAPDFAREVSQCGRQRASQFSWARAVESYIGVYRRVLAR
jgi:alpha-1,3-rhamnosyl/mannosyltransferase